MRNLAMAAFLVLAGPVEAQPERGSDAHIRELMQQALDDALHDQVKQLFAVWIRDDRGQPERAASGIRRAVSAYRHAVKAIENEKLTWRPSSTKSGWRQSRQQ